MAASYQATLETLQTASQHVQEVSSTLQSELSQLSGQIDSVQSLWRGAGASSFFALHQRWQEDAAKLNQVLQEISEALLANFNQYSSAEDAATSSMNRTLSQL